MEHRDTDDWFDRVMLFLANSAKPIAEEWFKLCEWFLVLAALSFLSAVTEHVAFDVALGISLLILWLYFMFHYQKLWYKKYNNLVETNIHWNFFERLSVHMLGGVVTITVASGMLYLAMLFGSDAADYLHSSVQ